MYAKMVIAIRMFAAMVALTLSACAAQGVPTQIENVAGAPTMICSALLAQQAQSLQELKSALDQMP
jgi:hypothetical protein